MNTGNVVIVSVAWIRVLGRSTRGLQSMPLVADGVLYYTGSYSRTFALDPATRKLVSCFPPGTDHAPVSRQTHPPLKPRLAPRGAKEFAGTPYGRPFGLHAQNA